MLLRWFALTELREVRLIAGWTQQRASHAIGINRGKLSRLECGEVQLAEDERYAIRQINLDAIRSRADEIKELLGKPSKQP
jgi:transcriptional regulator with XRE-family HTH domain